DLDGAKAQHIVNHKVLYTIATHTNLVIDFGGGLKTDEDLNIAFENGASMITGGSIAVKNPTVFESWIQKFGNEKIILGADVHDKKIAVSGWVESTEYDLFPFLESYTTKGINKVICTDIAKDGMLQGTSVDLYKEIIMQFPELFLIASGGVSAMSDIYALDEAGIPAVIFGKAIYEGKISLQEIARYNQ
nr:1-(5-phosphoribosyl)-5-[(5-phosphoribosylamino)methylideneamino]imidazole-4-carboxamide isomerase [Paludibacteraceae bacterium]